MPLVIISNIKHYGLIFVAKIFLAFLLDHQLLCAKPRKWIGKHLLDFVEKNHKETCLTKSFQTVMYFQSDNRAVYFPCLNDLVKVRTFIFQFSKSHYSEISNK